MNALHLQEDLKIYFIENVPKEPKRLDYGIGVFANIFFQKEYNEYEKIIKDSSIICEDQEVADDLIHLHHAKSLDFVIDQDKLYIIPELTAEIKQISIPCPDGIEGCTVIHYKKLAILNSVKQKGEWMIQGKDIPALYKQLDGILGISRIENKQIYVPEICPTCKKFIVTEPSFCSNSNHCHNEETMKAAREYAESFKSGEWFENMRLVAFLNGAIHATQNAGK